MAGHAHSPTSGAWPAWPACRGKEAPNVSGQTKGRREVVSDFSRNFFFSVKWAHAHNWHRGNDISSLAQPWYSGQDKNIILVVVRDATMSGLRTLRHAIICIVLAVLALRHCHHQADTTSLSPTAYSPGRIVAAGRLCHSILAN